MPAGAIFPPEYVTQWGGSWGSGNGQFNEPLGIAVGQNGNVYVADSFNDRIQMFTSSGEYVTQWGTNGSGNGQFNMPWGVAVGQNGYVYVADTHNSRVQVFTSSGEYVTQWKPVGDYVFEINVVNAIAVGPNGNVYISHLGCLGDGALPCHSNMEIQEFTSSGGYVTTWGSQGSDNGQFYSVSGIAVDQDGNIYVADETNYRIQKFTSSGEYLTQWEFVAPGYMPHGIAIDKTGNISITFSTTQYGGIYIYTSSGELIGAYGQGAYPCGIATDRNDGSIYYTDPYFEHPSIYKYATYPITTPTVTDVSPKSGPLTGGTSVTITGSRFTGATAVMFGNTPATSFTVISDGSITAISPAGTAGTVDITITTSAGTSQIAGSDQFTYGTAPTVTKIAPLSGPAGGGTTVIITGSGFTGASKVTFGTKPAASFTVSSDTSITATSPPGSAGIVDITVTTPGGTSAIVAADQFTYKADPTFTYSPEKIRTADTVTFTAASVDPTTDTIDWDFGDGTPHSYGKSVVEHSYTESGSYTVKLSVTDSSGQTMVCTDHIVVARIPVVLVHGWHGSTESWTEMEQQLKDEGLEVWNFGYSSTDDPRVAANYLAPYIQNKRTDPSYNGQEYKGKIDIVCHSMGAIVSRYYMEQLNAGSYGENVRQWIGIAPAHHGSGGADAQTVSWGAFVYQLLNSDTALPQLMTTSPAVQDLAGGSLSPTTKYRVIAGYNPTHSMWFGKIGPFPALPSTIAKRTPGYGSQDGSPYYMTFSGDMIVAISQAYDKNMGFDAFPEGGFLLPGQEAYEFDHLHITHSQEVIDRVSFYLNNADAPLTQHLPNDEEIPLAIYAESFLIVVLCPVDVSITDPEDHTITKETNEIIGATYTEFGTGDDGTPDAMIKFSERKVGDYLIQVSPKAGAALTDTFTLKLPTDDGKELIIARNVPVSKISSDPYVVRVLSDGTLFVINPQDMGNPDIPPVPEFPSPIFPAIAVIGFVAAVLLIQRTRVH